ncbi:hypothetical protein [Streptomyces sp. CB01881]|uniref:hypothetical protein n=1 Tax=Streptomyces sp. CB01881 TaxID=2078691 RepID=UPI0011E00FEE|nr:hypothetical protein [Streptomyces sp. CB01881]TYC68640.1 hypothetical protein EH183_37765 [Streptomyces sp. CB01881]
MRLLHIVRLVTPTARTVQRRRFGAAGPEPGRAVGTGTTVAAEGPLPGTAQAVVRGAARPGLDQVT